MELILIFKLVTYLLFFIFIQSRVCYCSHIATHNQSYPQCYIQDYFVIILNKFIHT
jgi:hypothetical protein